jgi:Uma2 family endonuclease
MEEYMANGAQLGWLINPKKRSVAIYRPDRAVETLEGIDKVGGDGLVAGFVLELSFIWNPLEG